MINPNRDFEVRVVRGYVEENRHYFSLDGWYISKVYAIRDNEFLVYDPVYSKFEWVDFTKYYFEGRHKADNSYDGEVAEFLVTLKEEDNADPCN